MAKAGSEEEQTHMEATAEWSQKTIEGSEGRPENPAVEKSSWLPRPHHNYGRVPWGPGTSVSRILCPWPCSTNAASHLLSS